MSDFFLSQILIGIAFLSDLGSFQFKKREITLSFFVVSASLISIHYFLLGEYTAGFVIAVSAIRFFTSIFTTNKYLKYIFLILVIALGVYTFDGLEDIFSMTTGSIATFAAFQTNEKRLRTLMMIATCSIIIHNTLIFSPAAIALEVFFLCSNVISYFRFYKTKKLETKEIVEK